MSDGLSYTSPQPDTTPHTFVWEGRVCALEQMVNRLRWLFHEQQQELWVAHQTRVTPSSASAGRSWRCPVVDVHSNRGLRVNICRTVIILSALEWGAAPAAPWRGFGCAPANPARSPPFEWTPVTGHPGGHQTAVGGFKRASWCAAGLTRQP